MCGIVGSFGADPECVRRGRDALRHRGPDALGLTTLGDVTLGHARLAILDLDPRSDQPFTHGRTTIAFNGEVWNHAALRAELEADGRTFSTTGDAEVLAAALDAWGEDALPRLEGMFAVAWTSDGGATLRLARDRFGEVPLHVTRARPFLCASEIKGLLAAGADPSTIGQLGPGRVLVVTKDSATERAWHDEPAAPVPTTLEEAAAQLRADVEAGVRERLIADVPVAVLVSGGIDSAAIAWHTRAMLPDLVAFTAVMDPRSRDLRCARELAGALELPLVEVPVVAPSADDLAATVRAIEQPSKAQVEIAWPCLALARAVRASGARVVLSGEGSDELWASYGMSYHGVQRLGWHAYRKRLFLDQARKNFPRTNKAFMTAGVEPRLPFLNSALVAHALGLPEGAVRRGSSRPKAIMQEAYRGLLPRAIIDRPKLAFQDGLGMKTAAQAAVTDPRRYYDAEFRRFLAGR